MTTNSPGTQTVAPPRAAVVGLNLSPLGLPIRRTILFALLSLFTLFLCHRYRNVVIDDPYISFRYARNVVEGHGWVFNEGEHVEGYSNYLWTLVATVPLRLNVDPLGVLRILSVGILLGMLWLMCYGVRGRWAWSDDRPWGRSLWGAVLLASCYPLAVWAVGGLETISYTALVFASYLLTARAAARPGKWTGFSLGIACALTALSRPEGAMILALPLAALWKAPMSGRRTLLISVGMFTAIFVPYTIWRFVTFGTLIPNTVSAKVGGDPFKVSMQGAAYLISYFLGAPLLLAFFAFRGFWKNRLPQPSDSQNEFTWLAWLGALFIALQSVFIIGVGGDWMPGMRFTVPMLPIVCLLGGLGLERMPRIIATVLSVFLILAAPFEARKETVLGARILEWARRNSHGMMLIEPLRTIGRDLRALAPPDATLALTEAGVVPYYSHHRTIDLFGLIDPGVAAAGGALHESFDAEVVLARKPELVLLGMVSGEGGSLTAAWPPDKQMFENPRFQAEYRECFRWPREHFTDPDSLKGTPGWMILFQRIDWTSSIMTPKEAPQG